MNKKEAFLIEGLGDKRNLKGRIKINGAKNSALKAMAASVLFSGEVVLENIPNTEDIHTMREILSSLGAKISYSPSEKIMKIDATSINKTSIEPELARSMRASVVLTGPMLSRFGKVSFPAPGGCVIGARPIDLFIDGYKRLGATVRLENELYHIEAPSGLSSGEINFKRVSVGGTETLMMTAVLSKGKTVLENCAMEPEIGNVSEWLNSCGAKIEGIGTTKLTIHGTDGKLLLPKKSYVAIPDRIEAGSFLILGSLLAEELHIEDCRPDHLGVVIDLLRDSGVKIDVLPYNNQNKTIVVSNKNFSSYKAFNIETHEYPGFPTDLQSPIVSFLTQVNGESVVTETIFEGRFKYVEDLIKLGANITLLNSNQVLIKGPTRFVQLKEDDELYAHDIRAGFAVVIGALCGSGPYTIRNVQLIDRGYESLEDRLSQLGAKIKRIHF